MSAASSQQTARGARDAMAALLRFGTPYPLRNLPINYPAEVANDLTTDLLIRAAQAGVLYQLCTEEGKPIDGFNAQLSPAQGSESAQPRALLFTLGDLRDPAAFWRAISAPAGGVGARLRTFFEPATLQAIDAAAGPSDDLLATALKELSTAARQKPLYDSGAFAHVSLSSWTRQLMQRGQLTGADLSRLNRFLLEDAFPLAVWRTLALATPPIKRDITFTILASRTEIDGLAESTLETCAIIRAGIADIIPVHFAENGGAKLAVPYSSTPAVLVEQTQEGISYQLFTDDQAETPLSVPVLGNGVGITLPVNVPLEEDTGIKVKAYRTIVPATFTWLKNTVWADVGPNPAVPVTVDLPIVDFRASPVFTLPQPQASAQYALLRHRVVLEEYLPVDSPGETVLVSVPADPAADPQWFGFHGAKSTGGGQQVYTVAIRVPELGDGRQVPAEFTAAGDFQVSIGIPAITAGVLEEDTLFAVWAKKPNGESLILKQKVVVLVRPDPRPTVTAVSVFVGDSGTVLISNAQRGVRYRLLLDATGAPVGNPGYHHDERVIETARVETDFIVADQGDEPVVLHTDALTVATQFRVIAIKNATALAAPLAASVSIDATTPQTGGGLQAPARVAVIAPAN